MPNYINNNSLTFNGPATTADQYSGVVDMTGISDTPSTKAWFFNINVTLAGVFAVTLQYNPDPSSGVTFGWQDEARTSLLVYNSNTCTTLAQTHASIMSSQLRGGVISSTGTYNLLFPFIPSPFAYRLRFQLTSGMTGVINKISFSTGV